MKSLKSMSNKWPSTISWDSLLFGMFIIKKCVELSLTSFGVLVLSMSV